jgi:hypothetical protein
MLRVGSLILGQVGTAEPTANRVEPVMMMLFTMMAMGERRERRDKREEAVVIVMQTC